MELNIEILKKIISESHTMNEVLTKLGKNNSSTTYKWFKKTVKYYDIDITHFFTKSEFAKHQYINGTFKKYNHDEIFTKDSIVSRSALRERVKKDNLIEYKCNFCENVGEWRGKKVTLILDHINGINNDHRLENLRFLCPNCNATLETHCLGAKGYEKHKKNESGKNKRIFKPRPNRRKCERPKKEELITEINELGYRAVGRKYGVSDNAIRKWLKSY